MLSTMGTSVHKQHEMAGQCLHSNEEQLVLVHFIPSSSGVVKYGRWPGMCKWVLDHHLAIIGAPGAGKSELIKRLINKVVTHTNRDVILVDGKG